MNLNFEIIELANLTKTFHNADPDDYIYKVSYLVRTSGGDEMVVDCFPCGQDTMLTLPMITKETEISVYHWTGENCKSVPTGKLTVAQID